MPEAPRPRTWRKNLPRSRFSKRQPRTENKREPQKLDLPAGGGRSVGGSSKAAANTRGAEAPRTPPGGGTTRRNRRRQPLHRCEGRRKRAATRGAGAASEAAAAMRSPRGTAVRTAGEKAWTASRRTCQIERSGVQDGNLQRQRRGGLATRKLLEAPEILGDDGKKSGKSSAGQLG